MNSPMNPPEMKRYQSTQWNFALDIPKRWHAFPPVSSNSPAEVIRFASKEEGTHLVIIFRSAHDPKKPLREACEQAQKVLARAGFGNFATTETTIGTRPAWLLEFDRPQDGGIWSCREYFVAEETLLYTLGFGTNTKETMFELYERMAKSFEFSAE